MRIATGLDRVRELGARESGLAVVSTTRADGSASASASVVNAGVLDHPVTGEPAVAFVATGAVRKLANLRVRRRATVVFRVGWEWVAVEGDADLAGPDDPLTGLEPAERHAAVLVRPSAFLEPGVLGEPLLSRTYVR